jgi:hypothetical protein
MSQSLDSLLRQVSRIKLGQGVVGKVSTVLIVVTLAVAIVAASIRVEIVSLVALGIILILALPLLWRLITFAKENPYAALLEGADLLKHEERIMGSKSEPLLPSLANANTEAAPIDPETRRLSASPDQSELASGISDEG